MATDFKCEDGKVLSRTEAADMLLYDEAGVARPDAYADVVFDATGIRGAAYRCKTKAEKQASDEAAAVITESAAERAAKIAAIRNEAHTAMANQDDMGSQPVSNFVRSTVNDAGESTETASGDAKSDGDGKPASTRSRS